jgi:hypothetical protein
MMKSKVMAKFFLAAVLWLLNTAQLKAQTAYGVHGSIINTTYNTYYKNGRWEATMGPLTPFDYGLACDNTAIAEGNRRKYREGDYAIWFVAPSDVINSLGLQTCGLNKNGGEPSCVENWKLCGRKLRISCRPDSPWCNQPGQASLLAEMNRGRLIRNNYIPRYYQDLTSQAVGMAPSTPRSVVLYITDFCPFQHSENKSTGHCQGPQLDVSTSAFLLLAKANDQGWIDSGLKYDATLLPEWDQSSPGPEW